MDKLTPTKFSIVKNITGNKNGKDYAFNSIGFLTREYGDKKWYNIAFNGDCPLKEGITYELEVTERTYTGKDGQTKIAYQTKLPSKESELNKAIMRHEGEIGKLWQAVKELQQSKIKVDEDIPVIEDDEPLPF